MLENNVGSVYIWQTAVKDNQQDYLVLIVGYALYTTSTLPLLRVCAECLQAMATSGQHWCKGPYPPDVTRASIINTPEQ